MSSFKSIDLDPITSVTFQLEANGQVVVSDFVPCISGRSLRCGTVANLTVEARKLGDTPWINLETTPIDLTPYAPLDTEFQFRITADSSKGRRRFQLSVE